MNKDETRPLHCGRCGMPLEHAAEYHPIEFCILWENAYDPFVFVKEAVVKLGLVVPEVEDDGDEHS